MTSVRTFIRQQGLALVALFIALTGGVAYAANTVFSEDIVDGEVKSADIGTNAVRSTDIGNGQVGNIDVADDAVGTAEIADRSVGAADIDLDTITDAELADYNELNIETTSFNDPAGGAPTEQVLIDRSGYQIIARCNHDAGDAVTARVIYKSVGSTAFLTAVDSTAPGGVNDVTGLAHGAEAILVSLGPTNGSHIADGTFTAFRRNATNGANGFSLFGSMASMTNVVADCRFRAATFA
jgi:hypothetical protein